MYSVTFFLLFFLQKQKSIKNVFQNKRNSIILRKNILNTQNLTFIAECSNWMYLFVFFFLGTVLHQVILFVVYLSIHSTYTYLSSICTRNCRVFVMKFIGKFVQCVTSRVALLVGRRQLFWLSIIYILYIIFLGSKYVGVFILFLRYLFKTRLTYVYDGFRLRFTSIEDRSYKTRLDWEGYVFKTNLILH